MLLLVEDCERHVREAMEVIEDYKYGPPGGTTIAKTLVEARTAMNAQNKYGTWLHNQVILDFHFPLKEDGSFNRNDIPSALLFIPEYMGRADIVICTDVYHHAAEFHVYNHILRFQYPNIPLVDVWKDNTTNKDWTKALNTLYRKEAL